MKINHQSGVVCDIIWALSNQVEHTKNVWNVIQKFKRVIKKVYDIQKKIDWTSFDQKFEKI